MEKLILIYLVNYTPQHYGRGEIDNLRAPPSPLVFMKMLTNEANIHLGVVSLTGQSFYDTYIWYNPLPMLYLALDNGEKISKFDFKALALSYIEVKHRICIKSWFSVNLNPVTFNLLHYFKHNLSPKKKHQSQDLQVVPIL